MKHRMMSDPKKTIQAYCKQTKVNWSDKYYAEANHEIIYNDGKVHMYYLNKQIDKILITTKDETQN